MPTFSTLHSFLFHIMNLPFSTSSTAGLVVAAVLGLLFGILLQKGRVTDYTVIVNLFRLRDWTVLRIMLTAILVGGIGVYALMSAGVLDTYHIKDTNLLGLLVGGALFGVGMVLYGYCPGTGVAAVATGSLHALVGMLGMIAGGIVYAVSFPWIKTHLLDVKSYGELRLTEVTGMPEWLLWVALAVVALIVFRLLPRRQAA